LSSKHTWPSAAASWRHAGHFRLHASPVLLGPSWFSWQSYSLDTVSGMQHASSVAPLWFVCIFDCNISELQSIWFLAIATETAGIWSYRTQYRSIEVCVIEYLDGNNHVSTRINNLYIYTCISLFVFL
jgi:hypothetical protein